MQPVTMTSRYMEQQDPATYRRLMITHAALTIRRPAKNYLTREQLEDLLAIARAEKQGVNPHKNCPKDCPAPQAEILLLLCGYCGLRISEAGKLQIKDIDAKRATVSISDGKNEYSDRVIPVPRCIAERVLKLASGRTWLFPNEEGTAPQANAKDTVSKRVFAIYKRGGITGLAPRDLRKTFSNLCAKAGVADSIAQAYMGQRPNSVYAAHYADLADVDLLLARLVNVIHPEPKVVQEKRHSKVGTILVQSHQSREARIA